MPQEKEKTCKERIEEAWKHTREQLYMLYVCKDEEAIKRYLMEDYGYKEDDLYSTAKILETQRIIGREHPLDVSYYEPGARGEEQEEGYTEFLMSTGGPADMLRFYDSGRIGYVFQDWFDGAEIDVSNDKTALTVKSEIA